MRQFLFFLLIVAVAMGACKTGGASASRSDDPGNSQYPVTSPTPRGDTYWVVSVLNLNGSVLYSNVLQLPTADEESVKAALDAGDKTGSGRASAAHSFATEAEADKWLSRIDKGLRTIAVTRDDIIPRLCVSQPKVDPTDYWVATARNMGYSDVDLHPIDHHYITSPLFLPPHSEKAITRAIVGWTYLNEKSSWGVGALENLKLAKFANAADAKAFVAKNGGEHVDLTAETLNKYLCANQPEESNPTSNPGSQH